MSVIGSMRVDQRPKYFIDTMYLWCSADAYHDRTTSFGRFIREGTAYELQGTVTPRVWMNYICNDRYALCVSNTARGYGWYKMQVHNVTRRFRANQSQSEAPGRDILIHDLESGNSWNIFNNADKLRSVHEFGHTEFYIRRGDLCLELTVFVSIEDSGECWIIRMENKGSKTRHLRITYEQTWDFRPYIPDRSSVLQQELTDAIRPQIADILGGLHAFVNQEGYVLRHRLLMGCPSAEAACEQLAENCRESKLYRKCRLCHTIELPSDQIGRWEVFSGVAEKDDELRKLRDKYCSSQVYQAEYDRLTDIRKQQINQPSCRIPSPEVERWLNVWLKNQLHLNFHFNRGHLIGFRDVLQDAWGYTLIDPDQSRLELLEALSHMKIDGTCPRQYSRVDDEMDWRRYMDSGVWMPRALTGYIKETGNIKFLEEKIVWFDSKNEATVEEHLWSAIELLYRQRGRYGLCLVRDGDWNDALEGVGAGGQAVSAWLTIALYEALETLIPLYEHLGRADKVSLLRQWADELKKCVNENAWDGDWYVYGYTDSGDPIGSHVNAEGKIHLNAQTWAIFSRIASPERCRRIRESIEKYLNTVYGPMLVAPPYIFENVGRMAGLEPGTFENGGIYLHAAAFNILSDITEGRGEAAINEILKILPSNPINSDCRRTTEPYALPNFYCGDSHVRFGQSFYAWFTATAGWLLRIGFDYLLGIRPDYEGLRISPVVPDYWNRFSVRRVYRGVTYDIEFERSALSGEQGIYVNGTKIHGDLVPIQAHDTVVRVILEKSGSVDR